MVDKLQTKVVRLKDIPVGNRCLLLPDHKNGVDRFGHSFLPLVIRRGICIKNDQEYMLTRIYGERKSFSANMAAIDIGEAE